LLSGANAIKPVFLVNADVLGLQARHRFRIDIISKLLFRDEFDAFTAAADVERGFVSINREAGALG
jgi:hypothetical protein